MNRFHFIFFYVFVLVLSIGIGVSVLFITLPLQVIADETEMLSGWETTATHLRGNIGEEYEIDCPPDGTELSIWGTGIYTDDSSICTAAVHAGLIDFERGGRVVFVIREGMPAYTSSNLNNIFSGSWGEWEGSFVFPDADINLEDVRNSWSTTAQAFPGNSGQYTIKCPSNGEVHSIWGTDIYTDDSSICTAAVHAGIITLEAGGYVQFEIIEGQEAYNSTQRNGITSSNWDAWGRSFIFVENKLQK